MYGIFTNMCPKNHPNVGKYTIHGAYGYGKLGDGLPLSYESHRPSSSWQRVSLEANWWSCWGQLQRGNEGTRERGSGRSGRSGRSGDWWEFIKANPTQSVDYVRLCTVIQTHLRKS